MTANTKAAVITFVIVIAGVVAGLFAQDVKHTHLTPPPPEPVTLHRCGPFVADDTQLAAFAAAVIADGCAVQVARHPQDYGSGLWVVYGTRVIAGEEVEH